MPTKFGDIKDCTIYIDGNEYHGIPPFEATLEPVEEYVQDNIKFRMNSPSSFTGTCKINKFTLMKLIGVYSWVLDNCPNKRVVHLAKYAKKEKIRNKNFNRAIREIAKLYRN